MFLESQSIIDYSMLLGIHFRAPYHLKTSSSHQSSLERCGIPGIVFIVIVTLHEPNLKLVSFFLYFSLITEQIMTKHYCYDHDILLKNKRTTLSISAILLFTLLKILLDILKMVSQPTYAADPKWQKRVTTKI